MVECIEPGRGFDCGSHDILMCVDVLCKLPDFREFGGVWSSSGEEVGLSWVFLF